MEIFIKLSKEDILPQYKDTPKENLQYYMFSQILHQGTIQRTDIILYKEDWNDNLEDRHIIKSRYKKEDIYYYLNR